MRTRLCRPAKNDETRQRALASIEHALIDTAQRATEVTDWNWQVTGTQTRQFGDKREIVILLEPFGAKR